jgi:hypothetical protein
MGDGTSGSRDVDQADARHVGAGGDEPGELLQRSLLVGALEVPPDLVAAPAARRRRLRAAQWALEALPRGKGGGTLLRPVAVVQQERGHGPIIGATAHGDIGAGP